MRSEWKAMVVLMAVVMVLAAAIGSVSAQRRTMKRLPPTPSRHLQYISYEAVRPNKRAPPPPPLPAYLRRISPPPQNGETPPSTSPPPSTSSAMPGSPPPPRPPAPPPPRLSAPTPPSRTPAPSSLSGLSPHGQAATPIAPNGLENRESRKPLFIIVVISMLIVVLITCVTCGFCWWKRVFCFAWRRKKLRTGELLREEEEERPPKSEQQVSKIGNVMDEPTLDFATIRLATKDFTPTNKLGQGGFGTVYKGELQDGRQIAVKRLSRNTGQGPKHFDNEVQTLAKLQHRNLVRLLGGFQEGEEKVLVYEYVPNGSLDNFLFGEPAQRMKLDWAVRFRLINGVARGLLYLHEDSRLKIIHRDLKAGNVLLDEGMNPKISDFGTAKIFDTDQTQAETIMIMGTRGYMAPEYLIEGKVSVKLDVFSFGVLLLEIISGKKNFSIISHLESNESLLNYVWRLWGENKALQVVDDQILLEGACDKDEILRCIHIGLLCVQEDVSSRPRMSKVVAMLENISLVLPSITIPPTWKISNISLGQHTSSTISRISSEHGSTSC